MSSRKSIDLTDFYKQYVTLGDINADGETSVICPFHSDTTPSLSINTRGRGVWKCHSSACPTNEIGKGGGDVYNFYSLINEVHLDEARAKLGALKEYRTSDTPETPKSRSSSKTFPVTEEQVTDMHHKYMDNERTVKSGLKLGWTEDIVSRFKLGWDGHRIWIPIRFQGHLVNIRKYSPNPQEPNKVINVRGFGEIRIFPEENTDSKEIHIFEGEKDCILANALGINAITLTGGAGAWSSNFLPLFHQKIVYICYDIDKAGVEGSLKIAKSMAHVTDSVRIIRLPIKTPSNGDFTDYIQSGYTADDYMALRAEAVEVQAPDNLSIKVTDDVHETSLDNALTDRLFYKRSRMKVRSIGKADTPYMIPRKMRITCNRDNNNCTSCGIYGTADETVILDEKRPDILDVLTASSRDHRRVVRELFNLSVCRKWQLQESEHQFIEDVHVMPTVEDMFQKEMGKGEKRWQTKNIDEVRHMLVLNKRLEVNKDYELESVMFGHPNDRHVVHVVYDVRPCQSSLQEFKITAQIEQQLRIFKCQTSNPSETKSTPSTSTSQPM